MTIELNDYKSCDGLFTISGYFWDTVVPLITESIILEIRSYFEGVVGKLLIVTYYYL